MKPVRRWRFRGLRGGDVRAVVEAPELLAVAEKIFADRRLPLRGVADPRGPEIRLYPDRCGYALDGPSGCWYAEAPGEALASYEAELMNLLLAGTDDLIHLHAAAVHGAEGLAVLVGESGSGKSTLSMGLRSAGLDPLGDDLVMLDPGSAGQVVPFPRSIRAHRAALERHRTAAAFPAGTQFSDPYVWLHPPAGAFHFERIEPTVLVFLESGSRTALQPLSGAHSLSRLLQARFGPGDPMRDFECLRELSGRVGGHALSVSDFREGVKLLVSQLFSGGRLAGV